MKLNSDCVPLCFTIFSSLQFIAVWLTCYAYILCCTLFADMYHYLSTFQSAQMLHLGWLLTIMSLRTVGLELSIAHQLSGKMITVCVLKMA